jgi:hypothetical protein
MPRCKGAGHNTARRTCAVKAGSLRALASFIAWTGLRVTGLSEAITPSSKSYLYDGWRGCKPLLPLSRWELPPQACIWATTEAVLAQGHRDQERRGWDSSVWPCDQLTGALYQVSEAGSALLVAVGNSRRNRCAERACVERQRSQRLQQPKLRRPLRRRPLRRRLLRRRPLRRRLPRCRFLSWSCSATMALLARAVACGGLTYCGILVPWYTLPGRTTENV